MTVGTVLWALLHGWGHAIAILATTGWFFAWLWLAGHWHLAIGFHLAGNLAGQAILYQTNR